MADWNSIQPEPGNILGGGSKVPIGPGRAKNIAHPDPASGSPTMPLPPSLDNPGHPSLVQNLQRALHETRRQLVYTQTCLSAGEELLLQAKARKVKAEARAEEAEELTEQVKAVARELLENFRVLLEENEELGKRADRAESLVKKVQDREARLVELVNIARRRESMMEKQLQHFIGLNNNQHAR